MSMIAGVVDTSVMAYWLTLNCARVYELGKEAGSKVPEKPETAERWLRFEKAKPE